MREKVLNARKFSILSGCYEQAMHYSVNYDGCRPRQIVLDVLEKGKRALRDRYDATREGQVARGDAIWKRRIWGDIR